MVGVGTEIGNVKSGREQLHPLIRRGEIAVAAGRASAAGQTARHGLSRASFRHLGLAANAAPFAANDTVIGD